jgi:hypothetical protein
MCVTRRATRVSDQQLTGEIPMIGYHLCLEDDHYRGHELLPEVTKCGELPNPLLPLYRGEVSEAGPFGRLHTLHRDR